MEAFLILEDGTVFEGKHIGADKDVISEIVFNTSMAGYTEVFTDPSYAGQAVCMTYPLIGNYGVCLDDMESERPWVDAIIVRELSHIPSNFRCDMSIQDFMDKYEIPGIEGIDTRKLVRILREKGTMNGIITTNKNLKYDDIKEKLHAYTTGDVVSKVSCKEKKFLKGVSSLEENGPLSGSAVFNAENYKADLAGDHSKREKRPAIVKELNGKGLKVALLDVGAKKNIADSLAARGCDVTIYPSNTTAEEILKDAPDGIMLSNGPGDPKECVDVIKEVKKLYDSETPIFAICLGHQLMALATGADTFKMKYGHRGGNHPVKDLSNGRVYISSQNHGYVVDMDKLDKNVAEPAFINVNDGTNEGLAYVGKNIFTVQFHPEACPGPQDSSYLFDRFIDMMKKGKVGGKN
ncbi:MAG: carbamoyl phosphate synthase small subunit [Butyrivibrio sp.]|jgi:carbamoyl-phosphate synthase small subunit|uniref:Carbamoyl phosphate synthase small chain n=1 Tax=Butyrivibrio hungatei TaxID=185008 RepID=A0A1G5FZA4_9FIRM|nr:MULTISPECIES: carbamoyl phosphate synthase small subunit [Butyrivibrio]MBQ4219163.1 carbamoyl phosphate synthase small subunit [Butyrivibrio sp.]MBR4358755.1 carbamoyl phosphate synthase small subunit [Butyrivibrio sp.]MBR4639672.1 carbamoyl phosphate synthase small subunit [Butyrivibrio sp.]MEE3497143.1 carbamoyl phosphate synthase small subunit [Butyrivibrio sp.]SCY44501.1 carbamoyl-phosphate synthase small subunit [Butyrivibrio hungatei]